MYAYNRELKSLIRTYSYAKNNFNFLNVSSHLKLDIFQNKPVILLGAGPSLKKNIDFLKENQNKFLIVSIYGIMPYLKLHGITPDIVTQYDEKVDDLLATLDRVGDLSYLDNTIFIFSSHVYKGIVEKLPQENIYFFNAIHEAKINTGAFTAPSIGEITYGLLLIFGVKHLYLLGIDMALDPETKMSHFEGYGNGNSQLEANDKLTNENFSFRKNIIKVKGNFRDQIDTLAVYHISLQQIRIINSRHNRGTKTFNLSDGAYIEGSIPLKTNDVIFDDFECDKFSLKNKIKNSLNTISSNTFSDDDIEYNIGKLKDAKKLKEIYDSFFIGKKIFKFCKFYANN